jgi:DNA-binding MarR family transcriptional regulator
MPNRAHEISGAELGDAAELRRALRGFNHASTHVLRRHGLTKERYELLLAIRAAHGGLQRATVAELSADLGLAQSSVTQLARRAQDAGLVSREVSAADGRVHYLVLTAAAEQRLAAAVADLGPERERLIELLRALGGPA